MGIDITVHLGISHDVGQESLMDALDTGCPNVKRLIVEWIHPSLLMRGYPPLPVRWQPPKDWRGYGEDFTLHVPDGNSILSVWQRRTEFWLGTRWSNIWDSQKFQHLLRCACFDLAQLLGSHVAVYTPEILAVEGENIAEIVQSIRKDRGEPAPTLAALEAAEQPDLYSSTGCYYIDTFADL